jgi:hypothetical protein
VTDDERRARREVRGSIRDALLTNRAAEVELDLEPEEPTREQRVQTSIHQTMRSALLSARPIDLDAEVEQAQAAVDEHKAEEEGDDDSGE